MFCNNLAAVSRRLSRREGKLFPNQKKETFLVGTRAARKKHEHKLISFFLSFVTEKKNHISTIATRIEKSSQHRTNKDTLKLGENFSSR